MRIFNDNILNIATICLILVFLFIYLFTNTFEVMFADKRTPEQIKLDNRDTYLNWHQSENKYCQSKGLNLEVVDTYYLNDCQYIKCENSTSVLTYEICNGKKSDSTGAFVGGLLIGSLLK